LRQARVHRLLFAGLLALPFAGAAPAQNQRLRGPVSLLDAVPRASPPAMRGCCNPGPGTGPVTAPDFDAWSWWWELTRDTLLPARDPAGGPPPSVVAEQIVPALRSALEAARGRGDEQLVAACLVALAKIGRHQPIAGLRDDVLLPSAERRGLIGIAAMYSFGVAADASDLAIARLQRVGASRQQPEERRAAALWSLGLIGAAHPDADTQTAVLAALRAAIAARRRGAGPGCAAGPLAERGASGRRAVHVAGAAAGGGCRADDRPTGMHIAAAAR
jgi:hypothetical protein